MRSLGLDVGERRIGVAVSDALGISVSPLEVLDGLGPAQLREYVKAKIREGVGVIVMGLPLTCSGAEGKQARKTREFARALEGLPGAEIVLWDERLSSVEAAKRLREAGHALRGRRVDAEAAAVILQSYLEHGKRACDSGEREDA